MFLKYKTNYSNYIMIFYKFRNYFILFNTYILLILAPKAFKYKVLQFSYISLLSANVSNFSFNSY